MKIRYWQNEEQKQKKGIVYFPFPDITHLEDLQLRQSLNEVTLLQSLPSPQQVNPDLDVDTSTVLAEDIIPQLTECRNMIFAVYANLIRLRNADFLIERFCIFVAESLNGSLSRSNVANLVPLSLVDVSALTFGVKGVLELIVDCCGAKFHQLEADWLNDQFQSISHICDDILSKAGLVPAGEQVTWKGHISLRYFLDEIDYWRCTAELLDYATLGYTNAHIGLFDYDILGEYHDAFLISSSSLTRPFETVLQRQSLECMKPFLRGRQVWVFRQHRASLDYLYISARAIDLADTWGPMSKVLLGQAILEYKAGSGSIIPWRHNERIRPKLKDEERLCHWIPLENGLQTIEWFKPNPRLLQHMADLSPEGDAESDSGLDNDLDLELAAHDIEREQLISWIEYAKKYPFNGTERLLIGARAGHRHCLRLEECLCEERDLMNRFRQADVLSTLGTDKSSFYTDSHATTVGIATHGLTATKGSVRKKDLGFTWKEIFLWQWQNRPEQRDPALLENFFGVAISQCTMNAQRVRLVQLLGTKSIENVLEPYLWSDDPRRKPVETELPHMRRVEKSERKEAFFAAVRSSDAHSLKHLWDTKIEWQEELGKVLSFCLECLCKTGFDSRKEVYSVLWKPSKKNFAKKVTLLPVDHKWIRVLKESEKTLSMAVLIDKSLRKHKQDPCRGTWDANNKFSVLQTALCINETLELARSLDQRAGACDLSKWRNDDKIWDLSWDVSRLKSKTSFSLRPSPCRLKMVRALTGS